MANLTPKRYCIMCLADGEKVAATHVIDAAGYCQPCLAVMLRNGHGPASTLEEYDCAAKLSRTRLTPAQRLEIAATSRLVPATLIARKYGVTGQTILNIRKEFPEEGPMREELPTPKPAPDVTPVTTAPDESVIEAWQRLALKVTEKAPPDDSVPDSVPEAWDITLSVPSERASDIFATFTTQEKFDAIGFVLQRRMDDALNA